MGSRTDMLETAIEAARRAGRLLLEASRGEIRVDVRTRRDVKLEMDRRADEIIVKTILAAHPDHAVLTEERGRTGGESEWLWVIDPLDGTYNYSRRIPVWCVSIGLLRNGEESLGVIYDPIGDELYAAEEGQGATVNGERTAVSDTAALEDATVCFSSSPAENDLARTMAAAERLAVNAGKVRGMGAAASHLAYVAGGRADAFYDFGAKLWDVAAGIALVREAGGAVTTRKRDEFALDICVSNGHFHDALLREIGW